MYSHINDILHLSKLLCARKELQKKCNIRNDVHKDNDRRVAATGLIFKVY